MKICMIGPSYPFRGGISHHTTLLYRYLRMMNNKVTFFAFKRQYPGFLFPGKTDIDPSNSPLNEPDIKRVLDYLNPVTWMKTAIKIIQKQPEILIVPWWVVFWAPLIFTIALPVKLFSRTKIVFLCHNVIEHEPAFWKRILTKIVFLFGDLFITHSEKETLTLKKLSGQKTEIKTLFHPTYKDLSITRVEKKKAKKNLGISGKTILFFGFVRKYKGLDILLKAMPQILIKEKVTLMVAGEFWKDKQQYIKIIDRLGISDAVKIIDEYIPNEKINLFFAAADLVVQPYRSASGSGVCQLAYGLGVPVIATDVGSLNEVIDDFKNGRIIEPGNHFALASAIVESFHPETLIKYSKNAGATAKIFSWDIYIKSILDSKDIH